MCNLYHKEILSGATKMITHIRRLNQLNENMQFLNSTSYPTFKENVA